MKRYQTLLLCCLVSCLLMPAVCFAARDLTASASSAVTQASTIAKAASALGVLVGAIIYQIPGAVAFGQRVIMGGLIGAGLAFGGPSLLNVFRSIFGG